MCLLAVCLLLFAPQGMAQQDPLRVVAWNIEWFPGRNLETTPEAEAAQIDIVQKEIERLDPDILIATEIRDWDVFEKAIARVPDLRIHVVSPFVLRDSSELFLPR